MGGAIEAQWLVVFGHTQLVVTNTLFFLRNCRVVTADEVQSIRKTVLVDSCKVLFNKVLLTGRLRKDVTFREAPICPGNVGSVGSALAEVGFQAMIDVSGARPGDGCVVVKAFVEGEDEKPLTNTPGGGIRGLLESSVLFLCVKVVKMKMVRNHDHHSGDRSDSSSGDDNSSHDSGDDDCSRTDSVTQSGSNAESCSSSDSDQVDPRSCWESRRAGHHRTDKHHDCKWCPKRKTTGLVVGKNGKVPDAQPGPIPGSFIGPTILFPGVV